MIDKHILDRVAPNAANWAAGSIVNGMGSMMQRFWRANNLIAQGTTNPNDAREHSVAWAAKGYGVLLHCEGQVGWNSDHIDTLHPGIIEMGVQCHKHMGVDAVYAAPLIWKTMFTKNVSSGLKREYRYICKRLKITPEKVEDPSQAAWHLYDTLFSRKEEQWLAPSPTDKPFKERHQILTLSLIDILREHVSF